MPNHCENDLYISGPKEDVNALLDFIGMNNDPPEFNFDKIIPYPKQYKELDEKRDRIAAANGGNRFCDALSGFKDGFNSGGYNWCCENWGTKWGAYEAVRRDYGPTCITFQTAWSPPSKNVLSELHKLFPTVDLSIEYFEQGSAFCGGYNIESKNSHEGVGRASTWSPGMITEDTEWRCDDYRGNRGG